MSPTDAGCSPHSHRPRLAATLSDPKSGRALNLFTTAPSLQLYSNQWLNGEGPPAKNKALYDR